MFQAFVLPSIQKAMLEYAERTAVSSTYLIQLHQGLESSLDFFLFFRQRKFLLFFRFSFCSLVS